MYLKKDTIQIWLFPDLICNRYKAEYVQTALQHHLWI